MLVKIILPRSHNIIEEKIKSSIFSIFSATRSVFRKLQTAFIEGNFRDYCRDF